MSFSELNIPENYVEHLKKKGINAPSLIQQLAFPLIQSGESVVALSKTGTGKTLAYLLPLFLKKLAAGNDAAQNNLEKIVLVPTRELAHQVRDTLQFLSEIDVQKSVVVIGGEAEEAQIRSAKEAVWLVATPGRLLDLAQRNLVNLKNVNTMIFDEADRILDMGFIDDVRMLLKYLPKPVPQMLFFSATLHFGIEELAYEFGVEFQKIGVEADELTVEGLDHQVAFVGDDEKLHALCHFLKERPNTRGIVFSNYRDRAHDLSHFLKKRGAPVESLTAQLNQSQRQKIMEAFRAEKVHILVASDLAARGLDVQDLDFVVNWDLPEDPATYVHRVGRTARAGKSGVALSFVGFNDSFRLEGLEKFLGHKINRHDFDTETLKGPLPSWGPSRVSDSDEAPRNDRFSRQHDQGARRSQGGRPQRNQEARPRFDDQRPRRENSQPRHDERPRQDKPQHSPSPRLAPAASQPRAATASPAFRPTASRPSAWQKIVDRILDLFGLERARPTSNRSPEKRPKSTHSHSPKDRPRSPDRDPGNARR